MRKMFAFATAGLLAAQMLVVSIPAAEAEEGSGSETPSQSGWPDVQVPAFCGSGNLMLSGSAGQNPSFDTPQVTNSAGWDVFDNNVKPGQGWVATWVDGGGAAKTEIQKYGTVSGVDFLPGNDYQYVELDTDSASPPNNPGGAASIRLTQTLKTIPGADYTLSFWLHPRPEYGVDDNKVSIWWNGVELDAVMAADGVTGVATPIERDGTNSDDLVWKKYTASVKATSISTELAFQDEGIANSFGMLLDEVGLSANCGSILGKKLNRDEKPQLRIGWFILI